MYSKPGQGTTFKIYLPRVMAAAETGAPFLQKPFTLYALASKVRQVLDAPVEVPAAETYLQRT